MHVVFDNLIPCLRILKVDNVSHRELVPTREMKGISSETHHDLSTETKVIKITQRIKSLEIYSRGQLLDLPFVMLALKSFLLEYNQNPSNNLNR